MRLIDCRTHELVEFMGKTPPYVALSHTWEDEEVTFQEMSIAGGQAAERKKRFVKIRETCAIALRQGYTWAWVDTCCIDKTSSAELSEAINSMFMWYRKCAVCYAFLSDYKINKREDTSLTSVTTIENRDYNINSIAGKSLASCRWFTRGWTLQELIAPATVEFYDQDWCFISTKHDMKGELSRITSIDENILTGETSLESVLVGKKMSWAASRQTTRAEDRAYSLLGIFDVNMPLLYGEGEKAFLRLQKKILKASTDLSIVAWISDENVNTSARYCSIFATDPSQFRHCQDLEPSGRTEGRLGFIGRQFDVTAQGLRTAGFLRGFDGYYLLPMDCAPGNSNLVDEHLCVKLRQYGSNLFVRTEPWELFSLPLSAMPRVSMGAPQFIAHQNTELLQKTVIRSWQNSIRINFDKTIQVKYSPLQNWDVLNGRLLNDGYRDFWGYCRLSLPACIPKFSDTSLDDGQYVYVVCGRDGSQASSDLDVSSPFFCSVLSHSEMLQFNVSYPSVQALRQILENFSYPNAVRLLRLSHHRPMKMSIRGQVTQVEVDGEVLVVYTVDVVTEVEDSET